MHLSAFEDFFGKNTCLKSLGVRRPMLHEHQRCSKEAFVQFVPQHYP